MNYNIPIRPGGNCAMTTSTTKGGITFGGIFPVFVFLFAVFCPAAAVARGPEVPVSKVPEATKLISEAWKALDEEP